MKCNKFLLSIFTFIISCHFAAAQTIDAQQVFSNTHGIKQEEATFYEVEGYSVFVHHQKAALDEKGLSRIKKKYSISKEVAAIDDKAFPSAKVLVRTENRTKKVTESGIYYLFPQGESEVKIVGLQTTNKRDEELERFFVRSIMDSTIPGSVYTSMAVDSIRFAGRYIVLGSACRWMGTHNIQCPDMGQMNWAEFRSIEPAQEMIAAQYDIIANKSIGKILQQDTVDILFEGTPAKAIKTKYKIKVPQLIMGGSNILIIYYVVAEVRGKYIACVLSHYTDDVHAKRLPPLLSEVMKLQD